MSNWSYHLANFSLDRRMRLSISSGSEKSKYTLPIGLAFSSGDSILILGESATGKTRLSMILAGLIHDHQLEVCIDGQNIQQLSARTRAAVIAFVPTNPALLFSGLATTLERELQLSLELLAVPTHCFASQIQTIIQQYRLENLLGRSPFDLSGGERVRAALALVMIKRPSVLIIDQIYDALSPAARTEIHSLLSAYTLNGGILIETHSTAPSWRLETTKCICLFRDSSLLVGSYAGIELAIAEKSRFILDDNSWEAFDNQIAQHLDHDHTTLTHIHIEDMTFSYGASQFSMGPIDYSTQTGEAVAITGPNGAGKSTFLKNIGLLLMPDGGRITISNALNGLIAAPQKKNISYTWAQHVLYAFQEPDDQIYCKSVDDEIRETGRRTSRLNTTIMNRVIDRLELQHCLKKSPMTQPRPIRRLITLGSVFAANPHVILLDEPTAELDRRQKLMVIDLIVDYCNAGGICLFISHDEWFIKKVATRIVHFANGQLTTMAAPA